MSKPFYLFPVLLLCLASAQQMTAQNFIGPVVETADLGFTTGGRWSQEKRCPPGSFVTAYAIHHERRREGKITALEVHCSSLNVEEGVAKLVQVQTIKAPNNNVRNGRGPTSGTLVNSSTYAIGFTMQTWLESGGKLAGIGGHQFNFHDEYAVQAFFPVKSVRRRLEQYICAENYGICSVQGKIKGGNSTHPSHITRLRFSCCYFCRAQEWEETILDAVNSGNTEQTFTYRTTSGAQITSSRGWSNSNEWSSSNGWDQSKGTSTGSNYGTSSRKGTGNSISGSTTTNQNRLKGANKGQSSTQSQTSNWGSQYQDSNGGISNGRILEVTGLTDANSATGVSGSTLGGSNTVSGTASEGSSSGSSRTKSRSSINSNTETDSRGAGISIGIPGLFSFDANSNSENSRTNSNTQESSSTMSNTRNRESSATRGSSFDARLRQEQQRTTQIQKDRRHDVETSVTMQWDTLRGKDARETIGTSTSDDFRRTDETSSGLSITLEQTTQTNKQLSIEKSMQQGAEEMFRSSYNQGRTRGYNWNEASLVTWSQETQKTVTIRCEPMTRCQFTQTVGTCGPILFRTPKVQRNSTHLPPPSSDTPKVKGNPGADAIYNLTSTGGKWIVARNISFWPPLLKWEPFVTCPQGSVVQGYQQSLYNYSGLELINGYRFICSEISDGTFVYKPGQIQSPITIPRENWTDAISHGEGHWARGYRFVRTIINGRNYVGNHELVYAGVVPKPLPKNGTNRVEEVLCPHMHAVCGLSTMLNAHRWPTAGLLTNIALKCCFHCQPEEHFVNKLTTENSSPETSTHAITFTVGRRHETRNAQSHSNSHSSSDEIPLIRSGFATRIGNSKSSSFDWSRTQDSLWTEETTTSVNFYCPPYHHCSYKQLVGFCGPHQFPTPNFRILAVPQTPALFEAPSDVSFKLKTHRSPLVVEGGHIFITFTLVDESYLKKGDWEPLYICPAGSVATDIGYRLDEDDSHKITGIYLQCSQLAPYTSRNTKYMVRDRLEFETPEGAGDWIEGAGPESQVPIPGFYVHWEEVRNEGHEDDYDDVGGSFEFSAGPLFDRSAWRQYRMANSCPPNYKICGFQYRMDENARAMTDIKFQCCIHCIPREEWKVISTVMNDVAQNETAEYEYGISERHTPIIVSHIGSAGKITDALVDVPILKKLFTHRFPNTSPKGFEWGSTPSSFWGRVRTSKSVYPCGPYMRCAFRQLHGVCGPIEIPTASTVVRREKVDPKIFENSSSFEQEGE